MVKVAIMGHGTVGSGVYEVFEMNAEKIARTVGEPVEVVGIGFRLRDLGGVGHGRRHVALRIRRAHAESDKDNHAHHASGCHKGRQLLPQRLADDAHHGRRCLGSHAPHHLLYAIKIGVGDGEGTLRTVPGLQSLIYLHHDFFFFI